MPRKDMFKAIEEIGDGMRLVLVPVLFFTGLAISYGLLLLLSGLFK